MNDVLDSEVTITLRLLNWSYYIKDKKGQVVVMDKAQKEIILYKPWYFQYFYLLISNFINVKINIMSEVVVTLFITIVSHYGS